MVDNWQSAQRELIYIGDEAESDRNETMTGEDADDVLDETGLSSAYLPVFLPELSQYKSQRVQPDEKNGR